MIGKLCQEFRKYKGITQKEVAEDLGYTIANISKFENNKNNNYDILLWYIKNGLDLNNKLKNEEE